MALAKAQGIVPQVQTVPLYPRESCSYNSKHWILALKAISLAGDVSEVGQINIVLVERLNDAIFHLDAMRDIPGFNRATLVYAKLLRRFHQACEQLHDRIVCHLGNSRAILPNQSANSQPHRDIKCGLAQLCCIREHCGTSLDVEQDKLLSSSETKKAAELGSMKRQGGAHKVLPFRILRDACELLLLPLSTKQTACQPASIFSPANEEIKFACDKIFGKARTWAEAELAKCINLGTVEQHAFRCKLTLELFR